MDQQQQYSNIPSTRKEKSGQKTLLLIIAPLIILFAGLAYVGMLSVGAKSDIEELRTQVSQLNDKTSAEAQDELLGFNQVNKDGYQAVFLNDEKVYFGNITEMNTENIVLENVFYLRSEDEGVSVQDQALVKLGCELHRPEDKMTIVRANVDFWENIIDDGSNSIAGAINEYIAAYPNGRDCAE